MEVSQIRTPKSFYVQEREQLYSSPNSAIFRELFQNSTDAGAKRIDITVQAAKGKGSFGRERTAKDVIRLIFADDGSGMTADIIDNVFFRPGESTKRGSSTATGGFGRARLLTAYSQVRYSLVTGRRAVEGDGPEYVHKDIDEMAEALRERAYELSVSNPDDPRIQDMHEEADLLRDLSAKGPYKGLRFEVDIDPNEFPERPYRNPTVDKLLGALTEYLQMSQVPCKVFVNGEERKERLLRGPVKRTLKAKGEDGIEREFATVHTSRGDKATYKQQVLVRVDGATMFTSSISTDVQVIVELDKSMAREVMTANRDWLREPYATAFEELKADINIDVRSALDDSKHKSVTLPGALGAMTARRPYKALDIKTIPEFVETDDATRDASDEQAEAADLKATGVSELELEGYAGVPFHLLERFFEDVRWGDAFITRMNNEDLHNRIFDATSHKSGVKMVRQGLEAMTQSERNFVVASLIQRIAEQRKEQQEEFDRRLKGMPDVRIHVEGKVTGKIRDAMRRNDPTTWDAAAGKGLKPRNILTAWNVVCQEAIKVVLDRRAKAFPDGFEWTTGFLYAEPREDYRFKQDMSAYVPEAMYQYEGDRHYLLLNPIDSNGVLKYNPRDPMDLQKLAMYAAHEVSHIAYGPHNEDFAALMTFIAANMDMRSVSKKVSSALDEVRSIYRNGRSLSKSMDEDAGIRPADRIMAGVAPGLTTAAGVMASPENRHLGSAVVDALVAGSIRHEDGSVETDWDVVNGMERAATSSFADESAAELDASPGMH